MDGLLIAPVGRKGRFVKNLIRTDMPLVQVDRFFEDVTFPYVTSDNYGGGYLGVLHLADHGHTRIGYIQGLIDSQSNKERLGGTMPR